VLCSICGAFVEEKYNFCPKCGSKIKDACSWCWVKKKDNYSCGKDSCPGWKLLIPNKKGQKVRNKYEAD
jgi:predicted amidophosphoribosyltransferase